MNIDTNPIPDNRGRTLISDRRPSDSISYNQEQVCILEAFYPNNRAYNFQATIDIYGALDIGTLEDAVSYVVARHEMLRTSIVLGDKGFLSVVHDPFRFQIPVHDLTQMSEAEQQAAMAQVFYRSTDRVFDIAKLPLFAIQAIKLSSSRWVLIQVEHHVVHDGWSFGKLWNEIQSAYNCYWSNVNPNIQDIPAQYRQFVTWQRERMEGDYGESALTFWSNYLNGVNVNIGIGHHDSQNMFLQGKNFELAISQKTFAALSDTARRMAVSEFIVMFSVFAKLLATKSRAHDFTIGTAVNARTERQIEPIIGMIVNTVPVRVRVKDAEPFEALCRETQTSLFKTLRYQDVPLSLIVRRLGLGQKRGYNPIFQHCFSFHDADVPSLEFGDTRGQITEAQNQASKFDINVVVIPPSKRRGTNDARMFWQFSSEAFLGDEGPQLAGDYIQLLHDVLMRD